MHQKLSTAPPPAEADALAPAPYPWGVCEHLLSRLGSAPPGDIQGSGGQPIRQRWQLPRAVSQLRPGRKERKGKTVDGGRRAGRRGVGRGRQSNHKHPRQKGENSIFPASQQSCSSEPHDLNKTDLAACSNEEQWDKATLGP